MEGVIITQKYVRVITNHLMPLLERNKGFAFKFTEVYLMLYEHGFQHTNTGISQNLKKLKAEGKIVQVWWKHNPRYGVPTTRADGSKYILVKDEKDEEQKVEIEKEEE